MNFETDYYRTRWDKYPDGDSYDKQFFYHCATDLSQCLAIGGGVLDYVPRNKMLYSTQAATRSQSMGIGGLLDVTSVRWLS